MRFENTNDQTMWVPLGFYLCLPALRLSGQLQNLAIDAVYGDTLAES